MMHTCNPSTPEAEAEKQHGLHSETLSQKEKKKISYAKKAEL
jgi:hypothetical protein